MPIIKSAIKRAKQTIKRRERNLVIKREIKDTTKDFIANPSAKTLSAAHGELDTAVKKGLIKKNTAARRKSNLSKFAKASGVKLATGAKKAVKTEVKAEVKPATKKPAAKKPATKKPAATTTKKATTAKKSAAAKKAVK